jgi:hypothetical protein
MKKSAENLLLVCTVLLLSSLAAIAAPPTNPPVVTPEPSTILGFGVPVLMIGLGKLRSMLKK